MRQGPDTPLVCSQDSFSVDLVSAGTGLHQLVKLGMSVDKDSRLGSSGEYHNNVLATVPLILGRDTPNRLSHSKEREGVCVMLGND